MEDSNRIRVTAAGYLGRQQTVQLDPEGKDVTRDVSMVRGGTVLGIVLGTVSTIFVACPLLLWLGVSKQDLMPKARDEEALARRP